MRWKVRDKSLLLEKTLVMGVLNLTPDSFSDGGSFVNLEKAFEQAAKMIAEGADILDLGAESTRPGASPVSEQEELDRLLPILEALLKSTQIPLSIDTTKANVARVCLEKGAHIINDVSGLHDSVGEIANLVAKFEAGLILMHRRGNPETMNALAQYDDLICEVRSEIQSSIDLALSRGVHHDQIVIDPGLGFAKKSQDNFLILQHLESLVDLGYPVLVGPSRKSFIGHATGRSVQEREFGTAAAVAIAVMKGSHLVRVHEVGAMRDAVRVAEATRATLITRGEHYVRS